VARVVDERPETQRFLLLAVLEAVRLLPLSSLFGPFAAESPLKIITQVMSSVHLNKFVNEK
jgi:hypothetical protein